MDPRDTPAYRLHCALSTLTTLDLDQLDAEDRERVQSAVTLLEEVTVLSDPADDDQSETS